MFIAASLYAQSAVFDENISPVDPNTYYRYPFSFGIAGYLQLRESLIADGWFNLLDNRDLNGGILAVFRWTNLERTIL